MAAQAGAVMAKPVLDNALWERGESLLPRPKRRRRRCPGRKPLRHRQALRALATLRSSCPWSRGFRQSAANGVGPANVLAECKEIVPTTPSIIAKCCGSRASNRSWQNVIPSMAVVWAFIDGLLSGPSVGSIKCAAYAPVTNDATISTKPSSHSAASSFAVTSSKKVILLDALTEKL